MPTRRVGQYWRNPKGNLVEIIALERSEVLIRGCADGEEDLHWVKIPEFSRNYTFYSVGRNR